MIDKDKNKNIKNCLEFCPTDRDRDIIRYVAKYRFLTSVQLRLIIEGSEQQIGRRASKLCEYGYLERIKIRLHAQNVGGSEPHIYALANAGAQHICEHDGTPKGKVNWNKKNKELKDRSHIRHQLLISNTMIHIERACRELNDVHFIDQAEILERAKLDDVTCKIRWGYKGSNKDTKIIPDYVFGLKCDYIKQDENIIYYYLEADCSTETQVSRTLSGSSIFKKMYEYIAAHRQKLLQTNFKNIYNFVLFVTLTETRWKNMIEVNRHEELTHGKGIDLFLFCDSEKIDKSSNMLLLPLVRGKEGTQQLAWAYPSVKKKMDPIQKPISERRSSTLHLNNGKKRT